MTTKWQQDSQWFRTSDGLGLLAGSPLTYFRVSEAGAKILDSLESGTVLPDNHGPLTSRLMAAGAIHPVVTIQNLVDEVTVVIPAYINGPAEHDRLNHLVESLSGLHIIVVDDASPHVVEVSDARVIRHDINKGPGPSRNTGLDHVRTPFVAFLDSDTHVTTQNVVALTSVLNESPAALVAPRIRTDDRDTVTGEYDTWRSPLDLGNQPAVIRPLSRVPYVPSAVVVARADVVREIGAFDESIRLGEDVDLIWRLVKHGSLCLYVPSIECAHPPRPTVRALLRQRFAYGTSAARLERNHPHLATPLRAHILLLMMSTLVLSGNWLTAILASVPVVGFFTAILHSTHLPIVTRLKLTWLGFTSTTRLLAAAVTRAWWPLFLLGSFVSPQLSAMFAFSVLAPATFGLLRHKPRRPVSFFVLRIADDLAYGTGVWWGIVKHRSARCLLPVLTFRRTSTAPPK